MGIDNRLRRRQMTAIFKSNLQEQQWKTLYNTSSNFFFDGKSNLTFLEIIKFCVYIINIRHGNRVKCLKGVNPPNTHTQPHNHRKSQFQKRTRWTGGGGPNSWNGSRSFAKKETKYIYVSSVIITNGSTGYRKGEIWAAGWVKTGWSDISVCVCVYQFISPFGL